MFRLDGKAALVTGASGGIGAAIARALHAQGANVVLSGTRRDALEALAIQLGERAHVCPADLRDAAEPDALIEAAEKRDRSAAYTGQQRRDDARHAGAADVRPGLAGGAGCRPVGAVPPGARRACAACCAGGPAASSTSPRSWARPAMPARPTMPPPRPVWSGMSKALAQEVASRGITINVVAPGFVVTAMTDVLGEAQKTKLTESIPLRRIGPAGGHRRARWPIWRRTRPGGSPAPHCTSMAGWR